MERLAVLDVGSTSVHLLVADATLARIEPVLDESTFVALGAAVQARGVIGVPVSAELAGAMTGHRARAREAGAAEVLALATAAVRRAADGARLVRRLERDLGLPLYVLAAREEALLTLLGVTAGRPPGGELTVVDVGGGSTEIATAGRGAVDVEALDVGAATLAVRHGAADPPTRADVSAMMAEARIEVRSTRRRRPPRVVAIGGTVENLALVGDRLAGSATAAGTAHVLSRATLLAALEAVVASPAGEAAARFGIRPARARLLPAGAAILLALLDRWGVASVAVSRTGLREGALLARARAGIAWRDRLERLALAAEAAG